MTTTPKYLIYRLAALAALSMPMASCSSEPQEPQPAVSDAEGEMQLGVATVSEIAATGSRGEIAVEDINRIGLWAWKTVASGTEMVMMHDDGTPYEAMRVGADRWRYDISSLFGATMHSQSIKRWDAKAGRYDFVAFTPMRIPDTEGGAATAEKVSFDTDTHVFTIGEVIGNIPVSDAAYIRWLVAHTTRLRGQNPADYDMLRSDIDPISDASLRGNARVPLLFHYLTPVVEIRIYTTDTSDAVATELSFELTNNYGALPHQIYTRGSYSIDSEDGEAWSFDADGRESVLLDMTGASINIKSLTETEEADRRNKSTLVAELTELPQDVGDFYAKVRVLKADGTALNGIVPMQTGWAPNTRYIYYIVINGDNEFIVMDVDVDVIPWVKGDDVVLDHPFDNW